jgi:hypothetical protein
LPERDLEVECGPGADIKASGTTSDGLRLEIIGWEPMLDLVIAERDRSRTIAMAEHA